MEIAHSYSSSPCCKIYHYCLISLLLIALYCLILVVSIHCLYDYFLLLNSFIGLMRICLLFDLTLLFILFICSSKRILFSFDNSTPRYLWIFLRNRSLVGMLRKILVEMSEYSLHIEKDHLKSHLSLLFSKVRAEAAWI